MKSSAEHSSQRGTGLSGDWIPWLLGGIGLLIYLPGIWWGLPHATQPLGSHSWDVDAVTGLQTLAELHNLLITPKADWWVAYPLLHYLVLGSLYVPYLLLSGALVSSSSDFPYGFADPVRTLVTLTLIGRLVNLAMGIGIIVTTYISAKIVWNRLSGVLAATAVMFGTPMFYYARTGSLDVPVLFWTSVGILIVARCLALGFTVRRAVLLGAFIALAVSTKDQAYGAWLLGLGMVILVYYCWPARSPSVSQRYPRWIVPASAMLSAGLAYALASGLIFKPERFLAHMQFILNFTSTNPDASHLAMMRPNTFIGNVGLLSDVFQQLQLAIGPVFLFTGLIGLAISWRSALFVRALSVMALGHIILVILPVRVAQYRYVMFLGLVFAFLVSQAIASGLRGSTPRRALAIIVLIMGFGWLTVRGADVTYQMLFDARNAAGSWFERNGRKGDTVAFFGVPNTLPSLPRGMSAQQMQGDALGLETLEKGCVEYVLIAPDYSSDEGMDRSRATPQVIYDRLKDGSLGYRRVAAFVTLPLFHGLLPDLPVMSPGYTINPTVQIFGLSRERGIKDKSACTRSNLDRSSFEESYLST